MEQTVKHGAKINTVTPEELREILRESATSRHLAFGGDSIERKAEDWPVKGDERVIRTSVVQGDDNLALGAGAYVDVLPQNKGRGGVFIVNAGANPVLIYLVPAQNAQEQGGKVPAIFLPAGQNWNGQISGQIWVGPISGRSAVGSALSVAAI